MSINLKNALNQVLTGDNYLSQFFDFEAFRLEQRNYLRDNKELKAYLAEKYPDIAHTAYSHPVLDEFNLISTLASDVATSLTGFSHSSYILDEANSFIFAQYTYNPDETLNKLDEENVYKGDFYEDEVKPIFRDKLTGFPQLSLKELEGFDFLSKRLKERGFTIDDNELETALKTSSFFSEYLMRETTKYSG